MAEDASIRRLRLLLGKQRFEEESSKGKAIQQQEAIERAAAEAEKRKQASEESEMDDAATLRVVAGNSSEKKAKSKPKPKGPSMNVPDSVEEAPAPQKFYRKKEKSSPYSDTEYETDDDAVDWKLHEEAAPEIAFCPVFAVNKYPYKYLGADKDFMERVADSRFNNGQFWERKWSIFYVNPPDVVGTSPIFFAPATEVKQLLAECSRSVCATVGFPAAAGFSTQFLKNEPRPRFLGNSYSREEFDEMTSKVSVACDGVRGAWSRQNGNDRAYQVWQNKLEEAIQAGKQKKARNKAQAQQKRVASKQQWYRQLRRSQRYLGFRPPNPKEAKGATANSQDEAAALQAANAIDDPEHPPILDPSKPPQFGFDQDVVFIAIDVEAHESASSLLTEIGISTLDTRDLKGVAPGPFAANWRHLAKYRHFRMSEYRNHVNSRFISGCPARFEKDFGESEFIPTSEIAKVVSMSCKPPFPVTASDRQAVDAVNSRTAASDNRRPVPEPRNIVLVGHSFDSDIDYLRRAGFQVLKLAGLIEVLDTSSIHRAIVREINPTTLANVLSMCQIAGWNLHNAGNDAAFTLQAMMAMAVDHLVNPEHRLTEEQHVLRRETAIKLAGEMEDSDFHEWMLADGESSAKVQGRDLYNVG